MEHPDVLKDGESIPCVVCGLSGGMPLPSTVDGMMCLDVDFVMSLIVGWVSAIASVPTPKGLNSMNGAPNTMNGNDLDLTHLGNLANQTTLPSQTYFSD